MGRARWLCGPAARVMHSTTCTAVLQQRQDATAIARRTCLCPHSQRRLLNFAWHRGLFNFFSVATRTSAAVATRSICPVPFPSRLITTHTSAIAAAASKSNATHLKPGSTTPTARRRWTVDGPSTILNETVMTNDGLIKYSAGSIPAAANEGGLWCDRECGSCHEMAPKGPPRILCNTAVAAVVRW